MADLGHEPRIDPPAPGDQPDQETTWCDECGHPLAAHEPETYMAPGIRLVPADDFDCQPEKQCDGSGRVVLGKHPLPHGVRWTDCPGCSSCQPEKGDEG